MRGQRPATAAVMFHAPAEAFQSCKADPLDQHEGKGGSVAREGGPKRGGYALGVYKGGQGSGNLEERFLAPLREVVVQESPGLASESRLGGGLRVTHSKAIEPWP